MGDKSDLAYENYTQWIIEEAAKYKMPYPLSRYLSSTTPVQPMRILPSTRVKYQEKMDDLSRACDAWKKKYEKAASELKDNDMEIALQQHALQ